jgi:cardiolipin synthase
VAPASFNWLLLDETWADIFAWLPYALTVLDVVVTVTCIAWVLMIKQDSTSAVAWCLLILLVPLLGAALFYLLGYQHVERPLRRKRRHKQTYREEVPRTDSEVHDHGEPVEADGELQRVAARCGAHALTGNNRVELYAEGRSAYDAMFRAMEAARHHIHLQTFIFQPDATGDSFLELLTRKAKAGVEVRLLYDGIGSHRLRQRRLHGLRQAGGQASAFLPLSPLRRRIQVNLRNHRKILVVDGDVGFVGGLNVGDEYLGMVPRFGFWRDTHLRLEGPAVADLQRVFAEDWDFASGEQLAGSANRSAYFPPRRQAGPHAAQIIESGPDRDTKGIREMYFAAVLKARKRLWITSPYFVPDAGLRDALRLAGHLGVDVRFLGQHHPDKWLAQFAARYYWGQVLDAGVKVYQYTKGMIHSKVVLVDGCWASVGTANLDNRSLYLNFEVNCMIYSPDVVAELEAQFERDLEDAIRLEPGVYARRPYPGRLLENACRLMSPVL